jgi:hypothetical protein
VLVLAGAILGAAALVSNDSSDSQLQSPSSQPVKISTNNTNKDSQDQSQGGQGEAQSNQGQSQQQGKSQLQGAPDQVVIVPFGRPWHQGQNLQQHVRIEINNRITIGVKIYYGGGWYVITRPCHHRPAARCCTGRYFGTIRPPGYCGGEPKPPMNQPPRSQPPSSQQPTQPQQPSSPPSQQPSPSAPTGFLVPSVLARSVAAEQTSALASAPGSAYTSKDNATVTVTCTSTGNDQFSCTATDSDGDVGAADMVTVATDGSSWSDSGMTWTGPDVNGSYKTPAVSGYSRS